MITYNREQNDNLWCIHEETFNAKYLNRIESLFHQANGYMGVRAATEERYLNEKRGMFVAGAFNKFEPNEVTELPNVPDVLQMSIEVDGEMISLRHGAYEDFSITLDMKNAGVMRQFTYKTNKGTTIKFVFKRFVSQHDRHLICQKMEISSDRDVVLRMKSGIDGTITNTGVQHFKSGKKRIFLDKILQSYYTTTESDIEFCLTTGFNWTCNEEAIWPENRLDITSRSIAMHFEVEIKKDTTWSCEKISTIYTSRDIEWQDTTFEKVKSWAVDQLSQYLEKGYHILDNDNKNVWEAFWKRHDLIVETTDAFDQISARYSIMQLAMMTPRHDNRMNIGAKGLSGEAYKGHTFWDTEIFLLPFWTATNPEVAKSLLEHRYHSLDGARRKACENGYSGAMYPWESAWITDGEATPKWGAADVVTGQALPIICGDIEQHITSDVVYGVWYYFQMTGDIDFMEKSGYEIIFETATYWQSRWEWNAEKERYEITDVIGPDEYSENVNNNAFTNYMSYWNVCLAIEYYEQLKRENLVLLEQLEERLSLASCYEKWKEKVALIYLPKVNDELLLPQDDNYLSLPVISLEKYKNSLTRADIIKDYNMEQISEMQVSKQADVLVLMYLRDELFTHEVKEKNFRYYESRCLHDSSLSLSIHSILASDIGDMTLAKALFHKAQVIDLNDNPHAATEGIHAASMGGVWQCIVNGFAGMRLSNTILRFSPSLPIGFKRIKFGMIWQGIWMSIEIDETKIVIEPERFSSEYSVLIEGKEYRLDQKIIVKR